MSQIRAGRGFFRAIDEYELSLCLFFNSACDRRLIKPLFRIVSRLGDGVFWYSLAVILPVIYGTEAISHSVHMLSVGLVNVALYKVLKHTFGRQRPYVLHKEIHLGAVPLDWYSFPSGHTLHAVAFSVVAISYYSFLALILVPFAIMVALSRVILGLHYPSDVCAGALIGASVAGLSFLIL